MTEARQERIKAQAIVYERTMRARHDLCEFIELVVSDDHGAKLRLADMHRQWVAHVNYCWERGLKAMILAHFGSGKSSSLAVPAVAWLLGRDPNKRIKVVTNDDSNATRRVGGVAKIIESPIFREVFPRARKGAQWTSHELFLRREGFALDPSVQARGVLSTGIGGRADFILFDDVVDQKNSMDSGQRQKILDVVEQTWLSRLEPDARVLWVATPWHASDATHQFMQRPGWCSLVQRVSADCAHIEQEVLGASDLDYPVASLGELGKLRVVL